ncbi:hypothetical protein [Metabacillus bambusae]|uniref:Uncharacterized protein n=1 Tax=Metabacillus bambusae TaxID=2795218 RepID=A0ABS3N5X9_9BACI|nr:hypothetical protein [Metabacillus bambusae]MBO1513445.1 hypothetical protein [Metabacillus bambusae]
MHISGKIGRLKDMMNQEEYAGYLFVYFTGEDYQDGEQVYFALSKGNEPLLKAKVKWWKACPYI